MEDLVDEAVEQDEEQDDVNGGDEVVEAEDEPSASSVAFHACDAGLEVVRHPEELPGRALFVYVSHSPLFFPGKKPPREKKKGETDADSKKNL